MKIPKRLTDHLDRALWHALHAAPDTYSLRDYWRGRRRYGLDDRELERAVDVALSNNLGLGAGGMTRSAAWLSAPPRLWAGKLPRWRPGLAIGCGPGLEAYLGRPPDLCGAALVARARLVLRMPYPEAEEGTMNDAQTPTCPCCGQDDMVRPINTGEQPTSPPRSPVNWYCERCGGRLSSLRPQAEGD